MGVIFISTPSASAALDDESRSIHGARVVAVTIEPSLGSDPLVDYASLTRIGPWDDRNYQLTKSDLALLSPTEDQLTIPIPAFYRVKLRKAYPNLPKSGPAQYPHSLRHFYFIEQGGYRISGVDYYQSAWTEDGFVILDGGAAPSKTSTDRLAAPPGFDESDDVRVTPNGHFAESAIKFDPKNRQRAVAGAIEFTPANIASQAMFWTGNGGATWNRAAALPLGGTCCDPTVDWSSDGVHAYAATLGAINPGPGGQIWVYRSADGGKTWSDLATATPNDPRREITTGTVSDKEYLHVDKSPVSPWKDNLYLTWHDANVLKFSRSTDRGNTWSSPLSISDSTTAGVGSDISTDRAGNVYYFWSSFASRSIWVRKSTDGGATFTPRVRVSRTNASFTFRLPPMQIREAFVNAASDADTSTGLFSNRIYVSWSDSSTTPVPASFSNHGQVKVAFSSDGGSTWNVRIPHETADVLDVDRFHPWIGVGTNGIVHAMFYDNRRHAGREGVDFFHSTSSDGGDTWSAPARLTEEISFPANLGFQLGDYNGLDVAGNKPWGIFTDNRDETCVTASPSIDVYAVTPPSANTACSWAGGRFVCQGCTTRTLYSTNFDGLTGLAGWSRGSFLAGGTVGWQGVRPCGGTSGFESFRYSAANGTGTTCTPNYFSNEHAYAYPNSAASSGLGIVVPAFAANTKLYFRHQRDFDIDRDGGLISVSVDGVNFVPAPLSAYKNCVPNSLAASSCSPPGTQGLPIWSGTTTNFLEAIVDLDSACNLASGGTTGCAGKNVRVAFTAISDCGRELGGWNVDDVSVTACLP